MPVVTIYIEGADKLFAKLGRVQSNRILVPPMKASVIELESWIKVYPRRQSTKPNPGQFVSERQRRYVMAMIRRGDIRIPYVRTGKLGQEWTHDVETRSNGVVGTVGNKKKYAPYVQNVTLQARMHQGNWRTDAQAIQRFRPSIVARFKAAVESEWNRS